MFDGEKMSVKEEDDSSSLGKESPGFYIPNWVPVVKVEEEKEEVLAEDETNGTDQPKPTEMLNCNEQESENCSRNVQSALNGERSSIKLEDPHVSGGNSTSSLDTFDLAAVVKVEPDVISEDEIDETGNSAGFFETENVQTMRIKTEEVDQLIEEHPSPEERTSSLASSTSAAECNILIKREKDIGADDEEFQAITESNFRLSPKDEEHPNFDEKPTQSTTSYHQGNESSEWGLCEESRSVSSGTGTEDKHVNESQGFKLARVSVTLEDTKSHASEKRFSCTYCPAKFSGSSHLKTHLRTHTNEKPFLCTLCPAKFNRRSSLKTHLTIHTGEKRFSCTYCAAKFNQSGHLKTHLRTHTNEKPFLCTLCPAKFANGSDLKSHLTTHTGEKRFSCTYCPAKFAKSGTLKCHLTTHTGEKRFSCAHCSAKFNLRSSLKRHLPIHTGEKRFSCKFCPAKFSDHSSLRRHLTVHSGEKRFSCMYCSARFSRNHHFKRHLTIHSGEK